uniref:Uncharacterized protein n=2 Tax=Ornithorhynchus anatinus TaxID=9258 RepID=A0A6I8N000_ORNAN
MEAVKDSFNQLITLLEENALEPVRM